MLHFPNDPATTTSNVVLIGNDEAGANRRTAASGC